MLDTWARPTRSLGQEMNQILPLRGKTRGKEPRGDGRVLEGSLCAWLVLGWWDKEEKKPVSPAPPSRSPRTGRCGAGDGKAVWQ